MDEEPDDGEEDEEARFQDDIHETVLQEVNDEQKNGCEEEDRGEEKDKPIFILDEELNEVEVITQQQEKQIDGEEIRREVEAEGQFDEDYYERSEICEEVI
jgi:hypothetical protein